MSQKITGKNLTYSQNLPPFLAALHEQINGQTGPDPILATRRRAVKKRSASEDAEDAPLVLDDRGDVIVGVTVGADGSAAVATGSSDNFERKTQDTQARQGRVLELGSIAGIGMGKKRKAGKAVRGEGEDENEGESGGRQQTTKKGTSEEMPVKKIVSSAKDKAGGNHETAKVQKKKKSKKIRLSFEDDDATI